MFYYLEGTITVNEQNLAVIDIMGGVCLPHLDEHTSHLERVKKRVCILYNI
jgi:hypothetical protein